MFRALISPPRVRAHWAGCRAFHVCSERLLPASQHSSLHLFAFYVRLAGKLLQNVNCPQSFLPANGCTTYKVPPIKGILCCSSLCRAERLTKLLPGISRFLHQIRITDLRCPRQMAAGERETRTISAVMRLRPAPRQVQRGPHNMRPGQAQRCRL